MIEESGNVKDNGSPKNPFPFVLSSDVTHDPAGDLKWDKLSIHDFEPVYEKDSKRASLLNMDNGSCHLGFGTYGFVRKFRHIDSGLIFAIKSMKKKTVMESDMWDQVAMEVSTQMQLKHPNIVKCYAMFQEEDEIHVVLEYCSKGNLYALLRTSPGRRFAELRVFYYFMQLINALYYVHTKGYFHRDLKLENILVSENNVIKLGDFGWCANIIGEKLNWNFCGTLDYLAPEMVQGLGHDWRVDLWGMGVLLYEMLEGKPPFMATRHVDLVSSILKKKVTYPSWFSGVAIETIEALLQKKAHHRVPFHKLASSVPELEVVFKSVASKFDGLAD